MYTIFSLELDHILLMRSNLYAFSIFLAIFNHFPSGKYGLLDGVKILWRAMFWAHRRCEKNSTHEDIPI